MLHVTNGDAAARQIRAAGLGGTALPWRDVLHEGPVPADLEPEQLREVRSRFLAAQGWGQLKDLRRQLARRDAALEHCHEQGEVILWFEHDLYDQLQLLQILDRLASCATVPERVWLITLDDHPTVERFTGLGQLEPRHLAELFPDRRRVEQRHLELAVAAWRAFRSPDPTGIEALLATDLSALPFLAAALRRHLEQFPSPRNGLGRSESLALAGVAAGHQIAKELFAAQTAEEPDPFLGDLVFWSYLKRLAAGDRPLLSIDTPAGASFAGSGLGARSHRRRSQSAQCRARLRRPQQPRAMVWRPPPVRSGSALAMERMRGPTRALTCSSPPASASSRARPRRGARGGGEV